MSMKAVYFKQHGTADVLQYGDLPQPQPKTGEALIRVKAVALNHLDIWIRRGWRGLSLTMPHVTGADITGEVVSINLDGAQTFTGCAVGTRVMINPGIVTAEDEWTRSGQDSVSPGYKIIGEHLPGGLAEYVCVPIENLFPLPDRISFEEGAAPLLVGPTCWRMLFTRAQLCAGESVLVVGAGGGVNALSILLAKAAGATVIALTAGKEKCTKAITLLGADHVIDYATHPDWATEVLRLTEKRGVDVVVDNVGAPTMPQSLKSVARGGRIVTVGNTKGCNLSIDNRYLFTKQISLLGSTMGSRQDFIDAMEFIFSRGIKIPIDTVAPLSDGIRQLKRVEDGEHFGKIVLVPG
jgi:NADPH:quinone reductase-like Zn-dependent oxidoreductase